MDQHGAGTDGGAILKSLASANLSKEAPEKMLSPVSSMSNDNDNHVAISVTEGRLVRDLFYHGLLDVLSEGARRITVFTEAITVPSFIAEWTRPGVEFQYLHIPTLRPRANLAFAIRRKLACLRSRKLLDLWLKYEMARWYHAQPRYLDFFQLNRPAVLLATNTHLPWEGELVSSAQALGIPTLGLVKSWDNVYKGLWCRTERLAVWNEVNRQEVIQMEGYRPDEVDVVGPPAFDTYFDPRIYWTRNRLAQEFSLDPGRPIILFATLGYFIQGFDETCWMDVLLKLIDEGSIPGRPQVICRLHPWSRLEHFKRYTNHSYVRLSCVERYWPGLTWYMTREDLVLMANVLRHADVVITPASTMSLEAAIFDRPTLIPIFHTYQPERAHDYFNNWQLGKHYKRIESLKLIPFIRRIEDFAPAINHALKYPAWYREQRAQLVQDYVCFTDGRSTERLAKLVLRIAQNGSSSKT